MRFINTIDGNIVICALRGDLVAASAGAVLEQVRILAIKNRYLVLDLTGVGFMDSSGLEACMRVHAMMAEKGGLAAYACANESVGRVFSMTKADQKLVMASSLPAAIKKLNDATAGDEADEDGDIAPHVVTIKLGQDFAEIANVRATIRDYCERHFPEPGHRSSLDDFYLATTEAMNNAVEHSGATDIGVAVGAAGDVAIFKMITPGARFDPTAKRQMPDLDSGEELPEGGFGLAIIQELMDSVTYEYRGGKNILTLKKTITRQKEEGNGI